MSISLKKLGNKVKNILNILSGFMNANRKKSLYNINPGSISTI